MEDGEIRKSAAIDEVKKVSYKLFLILLLCLAMFSFDATDIESEITQRIAELELFFESNDSHPHFIKCVKNRKKLFT